MPPPLIHDCILVYAPGLNYYNIDAGVRPYQAGSMVTRSPVVRNNNSLRPNNNKCSLIRINNGINLKTPHNDLQISQLLYQDLIYLY